jgi:glycerol-1-phosphate dehydrogenase [NAD(P)+]
MQNITKDLLGKHWARIASPSFIALEATLNQKASLCLKQIGDFKNPLLVADDNTYNALGAKIASELELFQERQFILSGAVYSDIRNVDAITSQTANCDLIVAVGSGTINDLCKYASYNSGIPYVVFPTASSMNGYVSSTSSLLVDGLKTSYFANSPIGVFCDMEIISNAPYRLIRSGIGDTLCRSTAQADWLLSHLLLDTAYDSAPFELIMLYEEIILQNAALFPKRDQASIKALMKALLIGGFGMNMCAGSYPASQGEHIIAHALEKLHPEKMQHSFHGEHIAVTTLYMEKLQRRILNYPERPKCNLMLNALANPDSKTSQGNIAKTTERLNNNWSKIRKEIEHILPPFGLLESAMRLAELPIHPSDIGLSDDAFMYAISTASMLRNRMGFLDLS